MKVWRRRFNAPNGDIVVRYTGMFRCICGGRVPYIDLFYAREVLELPPDQLRKFVKLRRKMTLKTLEDFALNSELCHEGEDHGTSVST